jgi:hypothetical protein
MWENWESAETRLRKSADDRFRFGAHPNVRVDATSGKYPR